MSDVETSELVERDVFLRAVITELRDGNERWPGLWTRLESLMDERDALQSRIEELERRLSHYGECADTPLMRDMIARAERAEAEVQRLREALEAIILEFCRGRPRGYDGPDTYEEDDPVVIIARAALSEEPRQ